jgi:tetratricopeptide (TPR) repeat protein
MRAVAALLLACASLAHAQKPALEAAWKLIAQGHRDQAVSLLRNLIQTDPRNADAHLLLGSIFMEAGDRPGSLAQLQEAVRLLPKSAEAHNALGEAYNTFGDPTAARPEFERAVEVDPKHAQAHANLGDVLVQLHHPQLAAPHLDQAIRLFGNQPDAAYSLYLSARIYTDDHNEAKALPQLERAVALKPDLGAAWSDLGAVRKTLSDDAGALSALRRAVALLPDDAVAQYRLGAQLLENDSAHEAVEHLDVAVRIDPRNQSALNALQRALRQDGQTERATAVKAQLAQVIRERDEADQKQVAAFELNNRGAALEKAGDLRGALEQYRAALHLLPGHAGIRANVGVALLKLGNWQDGIPELREALRQDPGNAKLQQALDEAIAQLKSKGVAVPK